MLTLFAVREELLARLVPVPPRALAPQDALGAALADALVTREAAPLQPIALRAGFAVAAADTVGASPGAPVWCLTPPVAVAAGDVLPSGCDAVLPRHMVRAEAMPAEILAPAAPGDHVRPAGGDWPRGFTLARSGDRVTPLLAALAVQAGFGTLAVRRPVIAVTGGVAAAPGRTLLAGLADGAATVVDTVESADLVVALGAAAAEPVLALRPGEATRLALSDAVPAIGVAERLDAVLAAWVGLVRPALERLGGQNSADNPAAAAPLLRKLSSSVGQSDLALLAFAEGGLEPLAVGDLPGSALSRASAGLLLEPGLEGLAAGTPVQPTIVLR